MNPPIMRALYENFTVRGASCAFLSGVALAQSLAGLPGPIWGWLILPLLWGARQFPLLYWPVWLAVGFFWTVALAGAVLDDEPPAGIEGRDVVVEGYVASLPAVDARRVRFEFEIDRLTAEGRDMPGPGRVVLNWYNDAPPLAAGEGWRLTVRLKRPRGFMNPGGFDYEGWLFRHRLRATGYVREPAAGGSANRRLPEAAFPLQRARQALNTDILAALADRPHAGTIAALAIGERAGITEAQWEVFTRTGTNHLVAISGLHVSMVAGLVFFLARLGWGWLGRAALIFPAPMAAALAGLAATVVYSALAGFSVPTQRSLIMIAVVMIAVLMRRGTAPSHVLAWALLAVLIYDPFAVMEAGFWLSFGAVAVILFGMRGYHAPRGVWWKYGRVQWLVTLGLIPAMLVLFQRVSLISPVANLFAVPWVSLVVVPVTLAGTLLIPFAPDTGAWLLRLAETLLGLSWPPLEWLAGLEYAQWTQHVPPLWAVAPGAAGVALLMAPRGVPARWLGAVLLAPMFLAAPPRPAPGEAWFTLLDVGQGLAAVVRTAGHTLVYDTGPRFSERFDTGEAVVVPFLRAAGVRDVDLLVVSHGDMDHRGGVASVLAQTNVAEILSSVPERLESIHFLPTPPLPLGRAKRGGRSRWGEGATAYSTPPPSPRPCSEGQSWEWDGVRFEMLYPAADGTLAGNDASCVLRVSAAGGTILLPGDIEKGTEERLLRERPQDLRADILVAPHHGSKTSSTEAFVAAVRPRYVLFPVGYRNRYGFPKEAVVARYEALGAARLDSTRHGAITFHLTAAGITPPETYRQRARRYWHAQ